VHRQALEAAGAEPASAAESLAELAPWSQKAANECAASAAESSPGDEQAVAAGD